MRENCSRSRTTHGSDSECGEKAFKASQRKALRVRSNFSRAPIGRGALQDPVREAPHPRHMEVEAGGTEPWPRSRRPLNHSGPRPASRSSSRATSSSCQGTSSSRVRICATGTRSRTCLSSGSASGTLTGDRGRCSGQDDAADLSDDGLQRRVCPSARLSWPRLTLRESRVWLAAALLFVLFAGGGSSVSAVRVYQASGGSPATTLTDGVRLSGRSGCC